MRKPPLLEKPVALASDGKASSGAVCELETGALGHRRHATDLAPRAETDEGLPRLLRSVGDELLSQRGGLRSSCGSGAQECSPSFSDPGAAWTVRMLLFLRWCCVIGGVRGL